MASPYGLLPVLYVDFDTILKNLKSGKTISIRSKNSLADDFFPRFRPSRSTWN
jgi:hypothetical protein